MFERFSSESKGAVLRALETARRLGAEQVEPEHLLLGLAEGRADPAARALAEAGLDAQQIERAIEEDLVAALDVVGVPASVVASTPVYPGAKHPGIGVAAKEALERSRAGGGPARRAAARDRAPPARPPRSAGGQPAPRARRGSTSSPSGWRRSCRSRRPQVADSFRGRCRTTPPVTPTS